MQTKNNAGILMSELRRQVDLMLNSAVSQSKKEVSETFFKLHAILEKTHSTLYSFPKNEEMQRLVLRKEKIIEYIIQVMKKHPEQFNRNSNPVFVEVEKAINEIHEELQVVAKKEIDIKREQMEKERIEQVRINEKTILENLAQLNKTI